MPLYHSPEFFRLLTESHQRLVGTPLIPSDIAAADAMRWLYEEAPFCVLAHDPGPDPRFIYANITAQRCFEYDWDEMTALASRLSAEAPNREERQQLLDAVSHHGYASGYRGLRIAKSGRRFWIENVTVWNLVDADGQLHGQAATYRQWSPA